jgi:hypothetical protein
VSSRAIADLGLVQEGWDIKVQQPTLRFRRSTVRRRPQRGVRGRACRGIRRPSCSTRGEGQVPALSMVLDKAAGAARVGISVGSLNASWHIRLVMSFRTGRGAASCYAVAVPPSTGTSTGLDSPQRRWAQSTPGVPTRTARTLGSRELNLRRSALRRMLKRRRAAGCADLRRVAGGLPGSLARSLRCSGLSVPTLGGRWACRQPVPATTARGAVVQGPQHLRRAPGFIELIQRS